jgi:hypothetical protein
MDLSSMSGSTGHGLVYDRVIRASSEEIGVVRTAVSFKPG